MDSSIRSIFSQCCPELMDEIEKRIRSRSLISSMIACRIKNNVSILEVSNYLKLPFSNIEELEMSGTDNDLTPQIIEAYSKLCNFLSREQ